MAVTAKWYGNAFINVFDEEVDWLADTIKVMLVKNTYTPDQDAHDYLDDISASTNETTATGYTAGGYTLASKTNTVDSANNLVKFDAADVTWTITGTCTAAYAVIYDYTGGGTDATRPLLGYVDFGGDATATDGTFKITWDTDGILNIGYD